MNTETDLLTYLDAQFPANGLWRRFPSPPHDTSIKSLLPVREAPAGHGEALSFIKIARAVAWVYQIPLKDLLGRSRFMEHVLPRHVFFWACREWLMDTHNDRPASYPSIAAFVRFDHTSVLYGVRKIANNIEKHEAAIENIEAVLFPA